MHERVKPNLKIRRCDLSKCKTKVKTASSECMSNPEAAIPSCSEKQIFLKCDETHFVSLFSACFQNYEKCLELDKVS